jgi:hypothetical protein
MKIQYHQGFGGSLILYAAISALFLADLSAPLTARSLRLVSPLVIF